LQGRDEPRGGNVLVLDELFAGLEIKMAVREGEAEFVVDGMLLEDSPAES
jgi:hypothetical protein